MVWIKTIKICSWGPFPIRLRVSWTEGSSKQAYSILRNFSRISPVKFWLRERRKEISRKLRIAVRQEVNPIVRSSRKIHGIAIENAPPPDTAIPARSIICWVHNRDIGVQAADRINTVRNSNAGTGAHCSKRIIDCPPRRIIRNLSFSMCKVVSSLC